MKDIIFHSHKVNTLSFSLNGHQLRPGINQVKDSSLESRAFKALVRSGVLEIKEEVQAAVNDVKPKTTRKRKVKEVEPKIEVEDGNDK